MYKIVYKFGGINTVYSKSGFTTHTYGIYIFYISLHKTYIENILKITPNSRLNLNLNCAPDFAEKSTQIRLKNPGPMDKSVNHRSGIFSSRSGRFLK